MSLFATNLYKVEVLNIAWEEVVSISAPQEKYNLLLYF